MEQQLATELGERQVAKLIENHEVEAGEPVGDAAGLAGSGFGLEPVNQFDGAEEPDYAPVRTLPLRSHTTLATLTSNSGATSRQLRPLATADATRSR